jgi:TetR/AcrR family transcriptional regulator, cholesterol catabolism regulator
MQPIPHPAARAENRRQALLEAAARRFQAQGYAATSMRDIAADVGMQVGSIYYHFPSKAELRAAVHEEGMRRIHEAVAAALAQTVGPWPRLEAACVAHLRVLLEGGDFFQAVMREMPRAREPGRERVIALRDAYEAIFAGLLDALPLSADVNRHALRLMLLGALNWSHTWYRPGAQGPEAIARDFLGFLRRGLERPAGTASPGTPARPAARRR